MQSFFSAAQKYHTTKIPVALELRSSCDPTSSLNTVNLIECHKNGTAFSFVAALCSNKHPVKTE